MSKESPFDDLIVQVATADLIDEQVMADLMGPLADDVIAEITGAAPMAADHEPTTATSATVATLRRRHRSRRWIAAAACAAVVALAAVLAGLAPGASDPAYAVTVEDGVVVVNWVRDLRDGSGIGRELRAHGVDATVRAVPASPSQVGRVLVAVVNGIETGDMPPGLSWGADGTDEVFTWTIDPSVFTGSIRIDIGVEPDPGEPYAYAEDAFAPGEVLGGLHCALGEPVTAADLDKQLRRLDLDAEWLRVQHRAGSTAGDLGEEIPSDSPPSGNVLDVYAIDDHTVRVRVAPPGASPTLPIFTPTRPAAECTSELASRWTGVI